MKVTSMYVYDSMLQSRKFPPPEKFPIICLYKVVYILFEFLQKEFLEKFTLGSRFNAFWNIKLPRLIAIN